MEHQFGPPGGCRAFVDWLAANKPDVLCLQETKVPDSEFPAAAFRDAGYHTAFSNPDRVQSMNRTSPRLTAGWWEAGVGTPDRMEAADPAAG